jgi:CheY-like chemotaxis protein
MSSPVEMILLVDDEETVRSQAARVVAKHGYHVVSAGSPKDSSRTSRPCG